MITCKKQYQELPFAHRQPTHKGHCHLVHGHSWTFEFTFRATKLDDNGFVIDFGGLSSLKQWLEERFDHTLVLNLNDPFLDTFEKMQEAGLCKLCLVPNCGAEGIATLLLDEVNRLVHDLTNGRVGVVEVTVFEDSRNSATASI